MVRGAILDQTVDVPPGATIGVDPAGDHERYTVSKGGVIALKGGVIALRKGRQVRWVDGGPGLTVPGCTHMAERSEPNGLIRRRIPLRLL